MCIPGQYPVIAANGNSITGTQSTHDTTLKPVNQIPMNTTVAGIIKKIRHSVDILPTF
jgi:hypothetical protein